MNSSQETNFQMKELLDGLPMGLVQFDNKSQLTFLNVQAQKLLGYSLSELKGLSLGQVFSLLHLAQAGLLTLDSKMVNDIRTIVNKGGQTLKISLDCYKLTNGKIIILFHEVTKAQSLENMQIQTQTILDSVNNIIVIFDKNNKVIRCNQAFKNIFHVTAERITGIKEIELFNLLNVNDAISEDFSSGEEEQQIRLIMDECCGEEKTLLMQSKPIFNIDGEYIGKILVGSDISTYIMKQEGVQQQEKLVVLGQMAAGIVHEVRNPLTTILGYAKLIAAKTNDKNLKEYSDAIITEGQYLNKIVSDFLAFAKPQSPNLKEMYLEEIIESLALMLESNTFLGGIELVLNLSSKEKKVLIDENQIKQVILNIVKNAIEAMKDIDYPILRITTGCDRQKEESFIIIANNGKSISKEELRLLGTPFYTTKDKGTGLGLSISYQIIREHNGRIEVKSGNKLGTLFKISFSNAAE